MNRVVRFVTSLSVATLLSSIFGVLLNLAVPLFLPIPEYAKYSLMVGFTQVFASLCFEWSRICIMRFGYTADLREASNTRLTLKYFYFFAASTILVISLTTFVVSLFIEWLYPVCLIALGAAFQGLFDGQQAADRAKMNSQLYSIRVLARSVLALCGALGASYIFRDGSAAFLGFATAYPLASVIGGAVKSVFLSTRPVNFGVLWTLFKFGSFSAIGTNVSTAVPSIIRAAVVALLGLSNGGSLLIVLDLAQRVFATLAASINIVVSQNSIRAVDTWEVGPMRRQITIQVLAIASVLLPTTVLAIYSVRALAPILLSAAQSDSVIFVAPWVLLAFAIMTVRQYSIDPLFMIFKRTAGAPVGPILTIIILTAGSIIPGLFVEDPEAMFGPLVLVSSISGLAASIGMLVKVTRIPWPVDEALRLFIIFTPPILATLVLPNSMGITFEIAAATGSVVAICTVALFLDYLQIRNILVGLIQAARGR